MHPPSIGSLSEVPLAVVFPCPREVCHRYSVSIFSLTDIFFTTDSTLWKPVGVVECLRCEHLHKCLSHECISSKSLKPPKLSKPWSGGSRRSPRLPNIYGIKFSLSCECINSKSLNRKPFSHERPGDLNLHVGKPRGLWL